MSMNLLFFPPDARRVVVEVVDVVPGLPVGLQLGLERGRPLHRDQHHPPRPTTALRTLPQTRFQVFPCWFLWGLDEDDFSWSSEGAFGWGWEGFGRSLVLFRGGCGRFGGTLGDDLVLLAAILCGRDLDGDDGKVCVLGCGRRPE